MEDLVLSIDQCRHLQELGLDMSDAKLGWFVREYKPYLAERKMSSGIPTYTLQEILEKLPNEIKIRKKTYRLHIDKSLIDYTFEEYDYWETEFSSSKDSMLEMAYEALCWVLENGYLK